MTNTPMTSREAFESQVNSFCRGQKLDLTKHHDSNHGTYLFDSTECAYRAYQASEANQQAVISEKDKQIAELRQRVEKGKTLLIEEMALKDERTLLAIQQAQTIAELVEALEEIASRTQDDNLTWWQIKAREAIAKVKGK